MPSEYKKAITFNGSPAKVYKAFMDASEHKKLTGSKGKVSQKEGGKFTLFNGWLEGMNIVVKPNKKIVQAWRGKDWAKDQYSLLTVEFEKVAKGCKVKLLHQAIPTNQFKGINKGWKEHYWDPIRKSLKK